MRGSLLVILGISLLATLVLVSVVLAVLYAWFWAFIHPSELPLWTQLSDHLVAAMLLLLGQGIGLWVCLRWIIARRFSRPVAAFAEALRYARAHMAPIGQVDYQAGDELGELIGEYNQLVGDYRQYQRSHLDPEESGLPASRRQTYRDIFERHRAPMLLFDPDSLRILDVNGAAQAFYGLSRTRLVELTMEDLCLDDPQDDQEDSAKSREAQIRSVRGEPFVQCHRRADGEPRKVECLVSAIVDDDGESVNCALIQDVSERLHHLERLDELARFLAECENITATGHWFLGADGQMSWSREGYRIHGVDPEQFDGTLESTFRLIHPEDRDRLRQTLQRALRNDETFTLEARIHKPGGEERLIRYQGRRLALGEGASRPGIFAIVHDITEHRELEQRLREQERIQNQAARLARLGSFVWDLADERYRYCSAQMAEIFAETQDAFMEAIDSEQALVERIHPDDQLNYLRKRDEAVRQRKPYEVEFRVREDDDWRQLLELGEVVSDDAGKALRLVGSTQDISRLKAMEDKLRQETSFRSQAAKLAMLGTFVWDLGEDRCFFCSGELATIYGLTTPEEYTQQVTSMEALLAQVHPDDRRRYLEARRRAKAEGDHYQIEYRLMSFLSHQRYVAEIAQVLSYGGGRLRVVGSVQDISEKKRREQELQRLATTDELTGVFNRRHFMHLAGQAFMQGKRQGGTLSVLMMDIDHFKSINTRFEHAGGDAALQAFTRICQAALRSQDVLGRLGGEEFAVLLPGTNTAAAYTIAERIRHQVSRLVVDAPPTAKEATFGMTVSIGLATSDGHDSSVDQVLLRADSALFAAKDGGRNQVYPPENHPIKQRS